MTARFSDRFEFERVLWTQGVARVAGVDEAGRGPLAGRSSPQRRSCRRSGRKPAYRTNSMA